MTDKETLTKMLEQQNKENLKYRAMLHAALDVLCSQIDKAHLEIMYQFYSSRNYDPLEAMSFAVFGETYEPTRNNKETDN